MLNQKLITNRDCLFSLISRLAADRKLLIVAGFDSTKSVVKYSPSSGELTSCSLPPSSVECSAVAICCNKVIVAGGTGKSMSKIQIYDVETDTWTVSDATLKTPRYGAKAVAIENKIYVIGGHDGNTCLSAIEVLEMVDGVVVQSDARDVPSLKKARSEHTLVVRNDEIYVVGGYSSSTDKELKKHLSSCEVINITTNTRYDIAPLNEGRSFHAAVLVNDKLIVTSGLGNGGYLTRLSSVECYSFSKRQWSFLPALVTARSGHCSHVIDGKVYVISGTFPNTVECYDANPKTGLSRLLGLLGINKSSWNLHQNINLPSFRSSVVAL